MELNEATVRDLLTGSNRHSPIDPNETSYDGLSFKTKTLYFTIRGHKVKIRMPGMFVISRLSGSDTEKVKTALTDDIRVSCSCPDFGFGGFKYIGTELDYTIGKEQRFPGIRNPYLHGTICKHLEWVLRNIDSKVPAISRDLEQSRRSGYRTIRRDI